MTDIPRVRTPVPSSTSPFLNLTSPDLKSFKAFLRSPVKDEIQFTEMDFEAAYAILTKSPTVNMATTSTSNSTMFSNASSGRVIQPQALRNEDFELKDILFKSSTPPPLPFPPFSPNIMSQDSNIMDFETLTYYSKHDELLSQNESNALEQFLDSIMDDKTRQPELDPTMTTLSQIQENTELVQAINFNSNISIEPKLRVPASIEFKPISKKMFKEESPKAIKKKKLLTDEEKKLNHTTSEQKRRVIIKEAFDELVSLLPPEISSRKKIPSKSIVLEKAAVQIQKMQNINDQLRELLDQ